MHKKESNTPQAADRAYKALIKKLLADEHAPGGAIESDLKTALYAAACLYPLDTKDSSTPSMLRYFLEEVGWKSQGSVKFRQCCDLLAELVQDGALTCISDRYYVRATSLTTAELKVEAELIEAFDSESAGDAVGSNDFLLRFFVHDDKGTEYRLITSSLILLPGDVISVRLSPEKKQAFALQLIKPRRAVFGTVSDGRKMRLLPDDPLLRCYKFVFSPDSIADAEPGSVVIATVGQRTDKGIRVAVSKVVRDLGRLNNIIVQAVMHNNIPHAWPEGMKRALQRVPTVVSEKDIAGRRDLRSLPLMTIDGEDARDFDDAVLVLKEGKNYRLYVAIADVSYYVRPGTVLDREAVQRCNSVYFPNFVIPMLPEKLSNGICSLNPNVDRLCMVCEMEIDHKGRTTAYQFYPAVMNSHARLTYTEAWQMISRGTAEFEEHQGMIEHVKNLHELYQLFLKRRDERGGFEVESSEVHFVFDEELHLTGLNPVVRNDAHKLIEECMIAANVAAASFVAEHKAQSLYRVHEQPGEEKLGKFVSTLAAQFGLTLGGGDSPTPQDYNQLWHSVQDRDDAKMIGELMLRSLSKAKYSPDNIGHFGLALEKYAHFTSPIRRYADLQLHRSIKAILEKQNKAPAKIGGRTYNKPELAVLGERCTMREIAADAAEMEVATVLKCILVKRYEGCLVNGTVSAITKFGAFVHLDDFMVDGLLFIGNISSSFLQVDVQSQQITSPNGSIRIRPGVKMQLIIASVNVQERKIDLMPPSGKKDRKKELVDSSQFYVPAGKSVDAAGAVQADLDELAGIENSSPDDETADLKAQLQQVQPVAAAAGDEPAAAARDKDKARGRAAEADSAGADGSADRSSGIVLPRRPEPAEPGRVLTLGDLIRSGTVPDLKQLMQEQEPQEGSRKKGKKKKNKKKGKGK